MPIRTLAQRTTQSPIVSGGAKAINRHLSGSAPVPFFIPQTFINSLRDVGYNSTTSALCEHVDNAIQAEANEIRIYFNQTGKRGSYAIDTLVYDNGKGMEPRVLQLSLSFGGSMNYNGRKGIGRFGVGMKTAALSISPELNVYSWTEPGAIYKMSIDVNEIAANSATALNLPEPKFIPKFPNEITEILSGQMEYPRSKQNRLANSKSQISEFVGKSGTIIYMPNCDRLSYSTSRTLVDHATSTMSRVYREFINKGVNIYINNRRLQAWDPTYWMKQARHSTLEVIKNFDEKHSSLINTWEIQVPISAESDVTAPVSVRLYKLPYESWGTLPRKELDEKLNIYDDNRVTVMRNNREVFSGIRPQIFKKHGDTVWLRVRIDFSGELDEVFGLTMNKQGIRPSKHIEKLIWHEIEADFNRVKLEFKKWRDAKKAPKPKTGEQTDAERRAQEAEGHQNKAFPNPNSETSEEKAELEANIRGLAVSLKRDNETDEEAFNRVKKSRYITTYIHDDYHPFYNIESRFGKVILKINKAHPFYSELYEPLSTVVIEAINTKDDLDDKEENTAENDERAIAKCKSALAALDMVFFSLGRAQTVLRQSDSDGSKSAFYEQMHGEWSRTLKAQLLTK